MIEFTSYGTYGGDVHYLVNGREVSEEQYKIAQELEQRIKELK